MSFLPSTFMSAAEAQQAIDDIKRGINTVRARIYDLDSRKGWKALGYRSFSSCCMEEFPELHARTIQKQLAAAQVEASLKDLRPGGRDFEIGDLPEKHLRPLVSVKNDNETLVAAYTKAQEIAKEENEGKLTEEIVTRAVQDVTIAPDWTESELVRKAQVERGRSVVANLHSNADAALIKWAEQTERLVRIDRKTEWGNPFEMGPDGDRDTVCDSYEVYFGRKFSLHTRVSDLRGKVLVCWCYPQRCHGDYLVEKTEGIDAD